MPGSPTTSSSVSADNRRSQRVILRIAVLARVPQEGGELPITEDTFTVVVNAHGALLSLAMKVHPGQKLTLRNWSTAKEQDCRVIHVRDNPYGKKEVGIEFPFPNPRFWNIEFPPPDWKPFMQ